MGGYGSGRQHGRPIAEHCLRIDLAWMMRQGLAREGRNIPGTLNWTCRGSPSGSIGYRAIIDEAGRERLELDYTQGKGDDAEQVTQTIAIRFTEPNYGGKRWWMICPYRNIRVGLLYFPPGGGRFASRAAWQLGDQSQRDGPRDKPFERLFRLQKKLGSEPGWGNYPRRPKGIWRRTYERHLEAYYDLDNECSAEMMAVMG
mgnify:CR=1 FL=1